MAISSYIAIVTIYHWPSAAQHLTSSIPRLLRN